MNRSERSNDFGDPLKGVSYITNKKGEKTAVVIDLEINGVLWEDFYDHVLDAEREDEPRETLADVKLRLQGLGKLDR